MTTKGESELLITSMITGGIGKHEVLLPSIKTMTKFEQETRHRLSLFIKKKTKVNSAKCETTARPHGAICLLAQIAPSNYKHDAYTVLLVLKSDW